MEARTELTRTPRGLRRVRTGYAYRPPALGTYRGHRAACAQGLTCCTYGVQYAFQPRAFGTYHVGVITSVLWNPGEDRQRAARDLAAQPREGLHLRLPVRRGDLRLRQLRVRVRVRRGGRGAAQPGRHTSAVRTRLAFT